jgi:molecular chaperone DnaK
MAEILGIDLGTTYSLLARMSASGTPEVVVNEDGANMTPSVVQVTGTDPTRWMVGEVPRSMLGMGDSSVFGRFKRDMGTDRAWPTPNGTVSPTLLSAAVLRSVASAPEVRDKRIGGVVVTIPASFGHAQRQATMAAADQAGLKVTAIVNEPTAAAVYYAWKAGRQLNGTFAVFDLGGGTFDVTVMRIDGAKVEVLATDGLDRVGGIDFDELLMKLVQEEYEATTGASCEPEDYSIQQAEADKRALSKVEAKKIRVRGNGGAAMITLERDRFERSLQPYLDQIRGLCIAVLEAASVSARALDAVVLAGGSSRMPCVQRVAREVFLQEPVLFENPDEVVGLGAALYATHKTAGSRGSQATPMTPEQKAAVEGMRIQEISSRSFGTDAMRPNSGGTVEYNSVVISKGTKLPCSVTKRYYPVSENMREMSCKVTEGAEDTESMSQVETIWEGMLRLRAGIRRTSPILVTFSYDENQMMRCSFRDGEDGAECKVELDLRGADGTGKQAAAAVATGADGTGINIEDWLP